MIRRRKRITPELDMTSTADISFMLLIFFLVASSMDLDKGITRLLPPSDKQQVETQVEREKLIALTITPENTLTLNGDTIEKGQVRKRIATLIAQIGVEHLISIDAAATADYNTYFELQNDIAAAYRDVRNHIAHRQYSKDYAQLDEAQRETVRAECPQRIADVVDN